MDQRLIPLEIIQHSSCFLISSGFCEISCSLQEGFMEITHQIQKHIGFCLNIRAAVRFFQEETYEHGYIIKAVNLKIFFNPFKSIFRAAKFCKDQSFESAGFDIVTVFDKPFIDQLKGRLEIFSAGCNCSQIVERHFLFLARPCSFVKSIIGVLKFLLIEEG